MNRRTKHEIFYEILNAAMNKIKPTNLKSRANLNYIMMTERLNDLKDMGLIEEVDATEHEQRSDARTKIYYQTTESGRAYCKELKRIVLVTD